MGAFPKFAAPLLGLAVVSGCAGRHAGVSFIPVRNGAQNLRPSIAGIAEFPSPDSSDLLIAPDGAEKEWTDGTDALLTFDEQTHAVTRIDLPDSNDQPFGLALGKHGNGMWFTLPNTVPNYVGYVNLATHAIKQFAIPTHDADVAGIVAGPDNAMWFAEPRVSNTLRGKIGRIDLANFTVSEFSMPAHVRPKQITLGNDGALWFSDANGSIGRITTSGDITDYPIGQNFPLGITTGPDGAIWFAGTSDNGGKLIDRIDLSAHKRTLYKYGTGAQTPRLSPEIPTFGLPMSMAAASRASISRRIPSTNARCRTVTTTHSASLSERITSCGLSTKGRASARSANSVRIYRGCSARNLRNSRPAIGCRMRGPASNDSVADRNERRRRTPK